MLSKILQWDVIKPLLLHISDAIKVIFARTLSNQDELQQTLPMRYKSLLL